MAVQATLSEQAVFFTVEFLKEISIKFFSYFAFGVCLTKETLLVEERWLLCVMISNKSKFATNLTYYLVKTLSLNEALTNWKLSYPQRWTCRHSRQVTSLTTLSLYGQNAFDQGCDHQTGSVEKCVAAM